MSGDDYYFQIEWRELLVKRMAHVIGVLKRDAIAEREVIRAAKEAAAIYKTDEEAKEAWGWGEITEDEYRHCIEILSVPDSDTSRSTIACTRLVDFVNDIKGEIAMIKKGDEFVDFKYAMERDKG